MNINGCPNQVFEEEVHTNCTVIVYRNTVTGEEQICWWENDHPEKTRMQEDV